PGPAPFSLPIFVGDRDELLDRLAAARIFATALWPKAERDRSRHPAADWCARHLVSLPVDQRHDGADMQRIAAAVNAFARPVSCALPELATLIIPAALAAERPSPS